MGSYWAEKEYYLTRLAKWHFNNFDFVTNFIAKLLFFFFSKLMVQNWCKQFATFKWLLKHMLIVPTQKIWGGTLYSVHFVLFFCSPFLAILRLTIFGTCDTSLERSSKVLSFAPRAASQSYLLGSYEGLKFFRIHLIHSYIDSTLAHPTFTVRTFSRTS